MTSLVYCSLLRSAKTSVALSSSRHIPRQSWLASVLITALDDQPHQQVRVKPWALISSVAPHALHIRSYHTSSSVNAKSSKKGSKGGKGKKEVEEDEIEDDDDGKSAVNDTPSVKLPDLKALELQMEKKLNRLVAEFAKLRTGQANTELFKTIMVEAHGSRVPVSDAGQIAVKSPTKISIAVFDPALVSNVANAIRDCGMSLNPTVEGNNIAVNVPKPSKETRDALVKTAGRIAEKTKQDVRQVRKEGMDVLKKLKGSESDDDIRRFHKDIDALMEKQIEKVTKSLKEKESDING